MSLPNVEIEILNGQLGRIEPSEDSVAGLIISGVAASGLTLSTPKQIFTLKEAEDVGITATYDVTNTTDAWKQIKEFYDRAGNGAELWIMLVAKTTTLANICDKVNDIAKKLVNAASGRMRLLGVCRVPDGAYVPATSDGLDNDVSAAIIKAHELAQEFTLAFKPFRVLIGGRDFKSVPANLKNFRQNTNNRVGVVLCQTKALDKNAAVGFVLGQFANRSVQRNIGRVKDGDVGLTEAFMSDGIITETYESAWGSIHDKGYIFLRKFANKSGYYFNDDPSCAPVSDDYSALARGRVIDKAYMIAYNTFLEELLDDLEIDEEGFLSPAVVKSFQQKIENAIRLAMSPNEISGVVCEIDPAQNLLEQDKVKLKKLGIRPKGYAKTIYIPLGFDNPRR